jgi:hypothetical protein
VVNIRRKEMKVKRINKALLAVAAISLGLASASAGAAPIFWTDWTGANVGSIAGAFQAQGTLTTNQSSVTVTYSNPQGIGFYQASGGTDYWQNNRAGRNPATSPYTSAAVDNIPTDTDIVALRYAGMQTLNFSQAIANPVFAFVSLNGNGYAFNRDFELLSLGGVDGNDCGYWGCGGCGGASNSNNIGGSSSILGGVGVISSTSSTATMADRTSWRASLLGTFDSVAWRSTSNEYWNGFTVGVQGTAEEVFPPGPDLPEPGSLALLGLGLLGLVTAGRRKQA